jgi:hypothetical protein
LPTFSSSSSPLYSSSSGRKASCPEKGFSHVQ